MAEKSSELIVYGGIGKAARDPQSCATIKRELMRLAGDETLLVQSGKPVAVFRTHADALRVLLANSNLVGEWATWEHSSLRTRDGVALAAGEAAVVPQWLVSGSVVVGAAA